MKLIAIGTITGATDDDGKTPVRPGKSFKVSDKDGEVLVARGFARADNTRGTTDPASEASRIAQAEADAAAQALKDKQAQEDADAKAAADAKAISDAATKANEEAAAKAKAEADAAAAAAAAGKQTRRS